MGPHELIVDTAVFLRGGKGADRSQGWYCRKVVRQQSLGDGWGGIISRVRGKLKDIFLVTETMNENSEIEIEN